jgi:hypothetical protein
MSASNTQPATRFLSHAKDAKDAKVREDALHFPRPRLFGKAAAKGKRAES